MSDSDGDIMLGPAAQAEPRLSLTTTTTFCFSFRPRSLTRATSKSSEDAGLASRSRRVGRSALGLWVWMPRSRLDGWWVQRNWSGAFARRPRTLSLSTPPFTRVLLRAVVEILGATYSTPCAASVCWRMPSTSMPPLTLLPPIGGRAVTRACAACASPEAWDALNDGLDSIDTDGMSLLVVPLPVALALAPDSSSVLVASIPLGLRFKDLPIPFGFPGVRSLKRARRHILGLPGRGGARAIGPETKEEFAQRYRKVLLELPAACAEQASTPSAPSKPKGGQECVGRGPPSAA